MKLRITRRALRQIEHALEFIRSISPTGAASVAARLDEIIEVLKQQPQIGRRTNRAGVRRVVLLPYPYILFYRVGQDEIIVLRFLHASRRSAAS
ncbi:type II toxin-antitoxin system RelE/ParE family toxin [Rhizobium sp. 0TCS1.26]|uniref:type II toxin-antitoxin system RelE/ParE family toxin n=1 Tax=Rhizobium sp. 0TCS1.26 TaxID=3142623 RepID=UPI003D2C3EF0